MAGDIARIEVDLINTLSSGPTQSYFFGMEVFSGFEASQVSPFPDYTELTAAETVTAWSLPTDWSVDGFSGNYTYVFAASGTSTVIFYPVGSVMSGLRPDYVHPNFEDGDNLVHITGIRIYDESDIQINTDGANIYHVIFGGITAFWTNDIKCSEF